MDPFKLIRMDTTLDLSQKTEKVMMDPLINIMTYIISFYIVTQITYVYI